MLLMSLVAKYPNLQQYVKDFSKLILLEHDRLLENNEESIYCIDSCC